MNNIEIMWVTPVNHDQHKKYHKFGSRGSYFAPKSSFASWGYSWRRLKCRIDVDSCISIAILIFVNLCFVSSIHTSIGTYEGTQVNHDQHKKYHKFGSRGSYFAPKSSFASWGYSWRRLKCRIDVDSCISIAILIFVNLCFVSSIHTSIGTYEGTQVNHDQHKKYHKFGSRGSYFAPKSSFASWSSNRR